MDRFLEVVRLSFLLVMLAGVYFETGPFTTILITLVLARIEDVIEAVNINVMNVSVISYFLNELHPEEFKIDEPDK